MDIQEPSNISLHFLQRYRSCEVLETTREYIGVKAIRHPALSNQLFMLVKYWLYDFFSILIFFYGNLVSILRKYLEMNTPYCKGSLYIRVGIYFKLQYLIIRDNVKQCSQLLLFTWYYWSP